MKSKPSYSSIAYVLSKFPALSETFIRGEILELKKRGIQLIIFSLKTPNKDELVYTDIGELADSVYYSAYFLSWSVIRSNICLILRNPFHYVTLMWEIFFSLVLQPIELVKSLAIIPKTVFFAEVAQRHKCSQVHAHFCNVPTSATRMMSQIIGVPFSFTAHGSDIYEYPPIDLAKRIKYANPFITVSEYNRQYLLELCPELTHDMIKVIHCGIDLDKLPDINREFPGGRALRILTVARLELVKGLDILIEACSLLVEAGLEFTCDLIGDGSQRERLEALISEYRLQDLVHLRGAVSHEKVIEWNCHSDLFVLPSRREGIPVSVMEAMACNLPVVATRVYGIPELVDDGITGILVPSEDAVALAAAITHLVQDSDTYTNMARSGRDKIDREFNIKTSVNHLLTMW